MIQLSSGIRRGRIKKKLKSCFFARHYQPSLNKLDAIYYAVSITLTLLHAYTSLLDKICSYFKSHRALSRYKTSFSTGPSGCEPVPSNFHRHRAKLRYKMATKKTRFDTFKNLYYCQSRTHSILRLIREFETTFETGSRRFSRNHQWYYGYLRKLEKVENGVALHSSSLWSLPRIGFQSQSGPLRYFHPFVKEDSAGWMQRCTQYFFPRLTYLASRNSFVFLLLGTLWPRLVCSRCSRSRSRPKTVSISIGWNGPLLLLLLLLFLVVVLPLFRTFDGSTNGKRRKFVAGSLIFPIGLFSSNPKKFQRILLNARICFTTLDKKKQSCNSFSHPPLLHFPPHILFRSTVPFSRFIAFFHVNFLQSLTFAPSSSTFRLIILFTILRNNASFLHSFPFKIFTRIVHQSRNFSPFFLFISTILSRSTILSEKKERKRNVSSSSNSSRKSDHESSMLRFLLLTRSPVLFISAEEAGRKRRLRRTTWRRRALRHSTRGNLCCAHVFHFSYPSPVPLLAYLVFS